ncbi:MAG: Hsp20/alpha crystallin family protein [Methanoregula sp.]
MGTVKKQKKVEQNTIVPSTGVSETGISFKIICQLPGISEDAIRIDLEGTHLTISVSNQNPTVVQKVTVPEDSYLCKKKFRDGVLEIVLEQPF